MTESEIKLVEIMMDLQKGFNDKLMANWRENPPAYADAIWTEAAEAFNHSNWEWWKNVGSEIDYGQLKMELIDIWHFLMSELMTYDAHEEFTHVSLVKEIYLASREQLPNNYTLNINLVREQFRNLVRTSLLPKNEQRIVLIISSFIAAMDSMGMTWTEVYKLYVGKNTLNAFRQQNGYKTDTAEYKARWASEKGWEDNQYLTELLETLDANKDVNGFRLDIINGLTKAFNNSSNKSKE